MADASTRTSASERVSPSRDDHPRVLAVLVVKDGAAWLERCLRALARQTYTRLAVVGVDNGSTDGSGERLRDALGEERVLRLESNVGFTEAVARALEVPAASRASYFLLVHDDAVLSPNAVERMVECATRIRGTGVVGPKVLDGEQPRVLREVGLSTDRFGYPHSPLEEDELDQGQYDTIREVLFVSTTAMLVSRDAWLRAGALDERLVTTHSDLDFCWRVRLCGFRVIVDPRAVVHHFAAGERGLRSGSRAGRARYLAERAGLLSLLKNYRLASLLWVLPVYIAQGLGKIAVFLLGRRFATAGQILAAWGWNLLHLPGTIRRRVRGHAVRTARDRDVLRFMAPAGERGRRLVQEASALLFGSGEAVEDPVERRAVAERVSSFVLAHPVALGWTLAIALSLISFRDVLFGPAPSGAALPVFPQRAGQLFAAFLEPWHTTGFGSAQPASPALVPLGLASFLALGSPRVFVRLLLASGPLLAGISCYRAALRLTSVRIAAVAAASCYAMSAVVLWAASDGRVGIIVYLTALPWLAARVLAGFTERPDRPLVWLLGTGAILSISSSFFPATWAGVAFFLVAAPLAATGLRPLLQGGALALGGGVAAFLLVLPFAWRIVTAGGPGVADAAGVADWGSLSRLAPGPAPGSWPPALFLPIAGVIAFPLAQGRRAWWAASVALLALPAAWFAAAGYLPEQAASPVALVGAAAVALSLLVAFAFGSILPQRRREFGTQQIVFGALVLVVGAGLAIQSARVLGGGWAVVTEAAPPAWPIVATAEPRSPFRVLWLSGEGSDRFPPPGGVPDAELRMAGTSLRYGVAARSGRQVASLATPPDGPGFARLHSVLADVVGGTYRHAGSALATMGIRFVVSGEEDLPARVRSALDSQIDLDLVQASGGLRIYRTSQALPRAWVAAGDGTALAARRDRPEELASTELSRLRPAGARAWVGSSPPTGGVAVLSETYDPRWRLEPRARAPFRAFGWAPGFDVARGEPIRIAFDDGGRRAIETLYLVLVWAATMWATRRRGEER